ncbi:hypothetical protein NDU88_004500 [Pleurodeles waltl]|uniref:Uncharacterized protein n=1 Tax=Pleurodeles waltl TaxID=8319 RepID=A0AAV7NNM2_PLEWA|nr:hypothetical protein NDU88_004500 [Pleurodeles waltl]
MVSHHEAVPISDESVRGVPEGEEEESTKEEADDHFPGNRDQTNKLSNCKCEDSKENYLRVVNVFRSDEYALLKRLSYLAVIDKGEGHAVVIIKTMAQGMMTVVVASFTVHTKVPLPWKKK